MSIIKDLKNKINNGEFIEQSVYALAASITEEDIDNEFGNDKWLHNRVLNVWEFYHGREVLKSFPVDVSIPLIDGCNYKCVFCSYWDAKPRFLTMDELESYGELFQYTASAGINPAGEPFMHPQIELILKRMRKMTDHRCQIYTLTNGLLIQNKIPSILDNLTTLTFSINAATKEVYAEIMGTNQKNFTKVLQNIKELIRQRDALGSNLRVCTTYAVTQTNIADIPKFVKLVEELGFYKVWIRNLATANSNNPIKPAINEKYSQLPPYLHPDFERLRVLASDAINSSNMDIYAEPDEWEKDIFDQDFLANESYTDKGWTTASEGELPLSCNYPYRNLMDTRLSQTQPVCVYIEQLPGYAPISFDLGNQNFHEIWNSSPFTALRRAIRRGPKLPTVCLKCNFLCAFNRISRCKD